MVAEPASGWQNELVGPDNRQTIGGVAQSGDDYLFANDGLPLSSMAMLECLRGLRSGLVV
jgi:hypothetical protein